MSTNETLKPFLVISLAERSKELLNDEWVSHIDESLRIVPDDLWECAAASAPGGRLWSSPVGWKADVPLVRPSCVPCLRRPLHDCRQVQLRVIRLPHGRECSNSIRVRRDRAEAALIDPTRQELLAPVCAQRMVKEMQAAYIEHLRALQARMTEQPQELQELNARILGLRELLNRGDPDMGPDEIQAAIERAEAKAKELQGLGSAATPAMKVFTMLPRAAEACPPANRART